MAKDFYLRHTLSGLFHVNKIVTIHDTVFDKDFDYEGESHDFWELLYVERGSIFLQTKQGTSVLREGEIVFHKPNEFHRHFCNGKDAPQLFIVSFVCHSAAMAAFRGMHGKLPPSAVPVINRFIQEAKSTFRLPDYDPRMRGLELSDHALPGGQQMVQLNLEMLLILLLRESEHDVFSTKDAWERTLTDKIAVYLQEHADGKVTLSEVCGKMHYSKTLVCTIFRRVTGKGIMEYHAEMRMERAKELLRSGVTVSGTAEKLGFENPYYFSRVFKRTIGCSPRDFLKQKEKR